MGVLSRARLGRVRGLVALALVLLAVLVVRAEVVAPTRVSSESMRPTLPRGQVVLVDKLSWRLHGLDRGQLVEFQGFHDEPMLKRVVALGGDVVEIRDARLFVNRRLVREPYVDLSRIDGLYFGPETVPAGHLFVLGDNRAGSIDSRSYGSIDQHDVVGTAAVGIWPPRALR